MADKTGAGGLSIGVIMDGNGRWAKKKGLPRSAGHKKGADVFDAVTRHAIKEGVRALTFYAFSTENWSRSKEEVDALMDLFGVNLRTMYRHRKENNEIHFLGERAPFPDNYREMMAEIEQESAGRTGMILNIAVNYGGQQEIVNAARQLAARVAAGEMAVEEINEAAIEGCLYTKGQPMPDFILRTAGEQRLSNFLLWQSAYSEYIHTDVLWPDFTVDDFDAAVAEYHGRSRRFGGA